MNKMEVEGELDIHRDAENTAKRDLKMVALKIRTIRLQARECQGLLAIPRKEKETRKCLP